MEHHEIKKAVKDNYTKIVSDNCGCGCGCGTSNQEISKSLGYSDEEINNVPEANLGLGCGNPTAFAEMKEGHIVVDLGSGAGFDAFLAAKKVGKTGKVIGVDMTEAMLEKARSSAEKYGYTNVEFRHGDIEELPIDDSSVDIVISNCVINLAPDKSKVFKEAYRVLKPGGKLIASDIVLLAELTEKQREDPDLISCCVGGALLKEDYLFKIQEAGFKVDIVHEDTEISKRQYEGIPLESLKFIAHK